MKSDRHLNLALLIGLLVPYFWFGMLPVYFLGAPFMRVQPEFPTIHPIGVDMVMNVSRCGELLFQYHHNWDQVVFSPFYVLVFGLASKIPIEYIRLAVAIMSVTSLGVICFLVPYLIDRTKQRFGISLLIFSISLFGYGIQFDLERGQWNLPVLLCAMVGILGIRSQTSIVRHMGLLLFTVAIHLKIWPIFLIFTFWDPLRNKHYNLNNFLILIMYNIAFLFAIGPHNAMNFIEVLTCKVSSYNNNGITNHSIMSFLHLMKQKFATGPMFTTMTIAVPLLAFGGTLFGYFSRMRNGYIATILSSIIISMLFSTISHDYKLVLLTAGIAMFFSLYEFLDEFAPWRQKTEACLLVIIAIAYHCTLFGMWRKRLVSFPPSNTPLLILILIAISVLVLLGSSWPKRFRVHV